MHMLFLWELLGVLVIVIYLILKRLGALNDFGHNNNVMVYTDIASDYVVYAQEIPEIEPNIMQVNPNPMTNRTKKDHFEASSTNSAEELNDEKLCIICYDGQINCYFVPCGHSATCYECAKRIVNGNNDVCPVCRMHIQQVQRSSNS